MRQDDYPGDQGGRSPDEFRDRRQGDRLNEANPADQRIKAMKKEMLDPIHVDFDEPYIPKPKSEHAIQRRVSNVSCFY